MVTDVDHNHEVKVAVVTHNHYKGIPARPANDYAPFHKGGFISVGRPRTINIDRLKPVHKPPTTVEPEKLGRLIQHISTHILEPPKPGINFSFPGQNSPPDQWHLSERERSLVRQKGRRYKGQYRRRQRDGPRDQGKAKAQESRSADGWGVRGKDGESRKYSPDGRRSGWRDKTLERSNDGPRDKGKAKAQESKSPDRRGVRGRDGGSRNYSPDRRSGWRDKTESRGRQRDGPRDKGKAKAQESRSPDRRGVRGSRNYSPDGRSGWRDKSESRGRQRDRPRDKGKDKAQESRSPDKKRVKGRG